MRRLLPFLFVVLAGCAGPRNVRELPGPRTFRATLPGSEVSFEMVEVPAAGCWLGRTEVSWDEYLVWCSFDERLPEGVDAETRPSKPLEVHPYDRHWGTGRRPAVGMSRNAASRYARWLSESLPGTYRLPSEDEWRAACGERPRSLRYHAWGAENSGGRTQEVGGKSPNVHGLFDMLGNLWEYCADGYSPDEPERAVLRGGSWKETMSEITPETRLRFEAAWLLDDPTYPPGRWWVPDGDHLGFRLAWTADEAPAR